MKTVIRSFLSASTLLCAAAVPHAHAAGSIEVQWLEPARYSDAGRRDIDRDRAMLTLGAHLQKLGRFLPDGQVLKLQITDLNLAGEIDPVGWNQLRVLRGRADWPQMSLSYALVDGGRMLKTGSARLHDMAYLHSPRQDDLGYEKRMIDQWFKAEFSSLR